MKSKILLLSFIACSLAVTAIAQTTGSRLLAEVNLNNNGAEFIPTDSIRYYYSSTRGGDLTHPLKYDSLYNYEYSNGNYALIGKVLQTFDANNNVLTLVQQLFNNSTGTWVNDYQYLYTYDGNNNVLNYVWQSFNIATSSWVNVYLYTYTYDGSNNMISKVTQNWDATNNVWVNYSYELYTYNAANKETQGIQQNWNASTSGWINIVNLLYTYDIDNNQLTYEVQDWDIYNNVWVNSYQYISTYTNDVQQTQVYQTWDVTNNVWVNQEQYVYSNFSGSNPQTQTNTVWDTTSNTWVNGNEFLRTYNSYGQMTSETTESWNVGGFYQATTSDDADHYYYNDYALSVNTVSQTGGTANVYPVPAQNNLQIDISWNTAQNATIAIYDMQGRLCGQLQTGNTAQYHNTMNVANLAAGNYIIKIDGDSGAIVKHLVVAQ